MATEGMRAHVADRTWLDDGAAALATAATACKSKICKAKKKTNTNESNKPNKRKII